MSKEYTKFRFILSALLSVCLVFTSSIIAFGADGDDPGFPVINPPVLTEPGEGSQIEQPAAQEHLLRMTKAPTRAKGVFAMDAQTGGILSEENPDKAMPAASISKIMTFYLVQKKIASGKGSWGDKVKITDKKIDRISTLAHYSGSVRLKKGTSFTVRQLYMLAQIESNNAAAIMLGRWVSGTDKKFAKLMNKTAAKLGMENSYFVNACGVDNIDYVNDFKMKYVGGKYETNLMSPRDAALLAKALLKYPYALEVSAMKTAVIKGKTITSSNSFISDKDLSKSAKSYHVDGLKTGWTPAAGNCFVGTCQPDGRHRIIFVIMNDKYKFNDSLDLIKDIYKKNPVLL